MLSAHASIQKVRTPQPSLRITRNIVLCQPALHTHSGAGGIPVAWQTSAPTRSRSITGGSSYRFDKASAKVPGCTSGCKHLHQALEASLHQKLSAFTHDPHFTFPAFGLGRKRGTHRNYYWHHRQTPWTVPPPGLSVLEGRDGGGVFGLFKNQGSNWPLHRRPHQAQYQRHPLCAKTNGRNAAQNLRTARCDT